MGNIFDKMRDNVFDTTTKVMGYDAMWNGYSARVHFREIIEKDLIEGLGEYSQSPISHYMEYRKEDFPGLETSVRSSINKPKVTVESTEYRVNICLQAYDGRYYKCYLDRVQFTS